MSISVETRVIFATHDQSWYADLISQMREHFEVEFFHVPYFFEQQHSSKWNILIDSIALLFTVPWGLAVKGDGLYLLTTRHLPFLFWFRILSIFGLNFRVVAMNFYFHELREKKIVKRILGFLLNNPNLTIIAPSKNDFDYYRALSNRATLRYIIFGLEKNAADFDICDEGYIFCGGYNNRDFDLVYRVAEKIDNSFFVITSSREKSAGVRPSNVELLQDVDSATFDGIMAKARIVLVPLKSDVGASGQIVTLTAMLFGKPIVYTDFDVVSEYFEHNVTGLACSAEDTQEMASMIELLLGDGSLRERLGKNATEMCEEKFTSRATNQRIVGVLTEKVVREVGGN